MKEGGYEVEERPIAIDEIVEAHKNGRLTEAFGAGTAAVISHVASILYKGEEMIFPPVEVREIGPWAKSQINGVRSGRLPDSKGWLIEAGQLTGAAVEV